MHFGMNWTIYHTLKILKFTWFLILLNPPNVESSTLFFFLLWNLPKGISQVETVWGISIFKLKVIWRYQCQLNLYRTRQVDTEDAFNIFMVLQTLWQRPFSFWKKNLILEKDELCQVGEMDPPYTTYWRMMRHKEDRTDTQFLKIIIISVFLLRCGRWDKYYSNPRPASNLLKRTLKKD